MRIGLIASPWIPVPPPTYGGTELIVDNLARGLAARGHDVRLFTVPESTCPVEKLSELPSVAEPMGFILPETRHVIAAYQAFTDVDVIHDHTVLGPVIAAGHKHPDVPVVFTNHGQVSPQTLPLLCAAADVGSLVAISGDQHSRDDVPVTATIHHGIDVDTFPYGPGGGGYAMFLGRMNPDKGPERAIRIAREAGLPLVLCAKMWEPGEHAFFEDVVKPMLGDDVDLRLSVGHDEMVELLRHAEAVINPICWNEPFGLVMAEALSCGTPVLAFPRGAAPEIIEHGVTGWLGSDESELASVLARAREFDRAACRASVERRFSLARMARDHERLYERLVRRSPRSVAAGMGPRGLAGLTPRRAEIVGGATARSPEFAIGATRPAAPAAQRRRRPALTQANVKSSS
jgi:glycosyltransferase involved in cell wall biosynthesis